MTPPAATTELCGARTRKGGRCGRPAGWGTDHVGGGTCKLHAGSTPAGRKHGARLLAEKEARLEPRSVEIGPDAALTLLRQRAFYVWAELARQTDSLGDKWLTKEGAHPWARAEQEQAERAARLQKLVLDAGVEERKVRADEQIAAVIALAFSKFLKDPRLGITVAIDVQREVVRDILEEIQADEEPEARYPAALPAGTPQR